MKNSSNEGTFLDAELQIYKAAWDRDHAFDSMIGVYSNFDGTITGMPKDGAPEMPVVFVYGLDDLFISKDIAERTKTYLGNDNVKIYPGLSHWLVQEAPQMTATDILIFLENAAP